jgi:hypothetical protein
MRLRVAPPPASSRPVRVASPGCPVLRSLSPGPASESSGCPLVSVLRLCRRWMLELPRTSHAFGGAGFSQVRVAPWPASSCSAPDVGLQVSSSSCISGFTGDGSSSRPDARIFRRCRAASPRVAPSISLSVSPTIRREGYPALRILRHRLMDIRVTPDHAPIGLPWLKLRVAPGLLPWLRQLTNFQVALNLGSLTVRRFTAFRVAPNLWFLG